MKHEEMVNKMAAVAETILYGYKYITAGVERSVKIKEQNQRSQIKIWCYTLNGKFKGSYDLGYVDHATGEYVAGKDINLNNL